MKWLCAITACISVRNEPLNGLPHKMHSQLSWWKKRELSVVRVTPILHITTNWPFVFMRCITYSKNEKEQNKTISHVKFIHRNWVYLVWIYFIAYKFGLIKCQSAFPFCHLYLYAKSFVFVYLHIIITKDNTHTKHIVRLGWMFCKILSTTAAFMLIVMGILHFKNWVNVTIPEIKL